MVVAGVRRSSQSVCMFDSLSLSICPYNKTKMVETKITKLGKHIIMIPHPPINIRSEGQGHRVTECKKAIEWLV